MLAHVLSSIRRRLAATKRSTSAAALLFLATFTVYVAHPVSWESADSVPTKMIPVLLLTKGTLHFDDYMPTFGKRFPQVGDFIYFVQKGPHGYISFFPITPGLLLTPVLAPIILWKDRHHPSPEQWLDFADRAERIIAALLTSGCVVALFHVLCQIGTSLLTAVLLSALYAFGTNAFCTFSQQLWQHEFATLFSLLALLAALKWGDRRNVPHSLLLGITLGLAVACRPTYFVFLCCLGWWMVRRRRAAMVSVVIGAVTTLVPILAYNLSEYNNLFGGYYIHAPAPETYQSPVNVLAAMLLSPGRGLLLFFPVAVLSLVGFWFAARRRDPHLPLFTALLVYCGVYVLAIWRLRWDGDWYGGVCFGPRYLSDIQFALVLLLAPLLAYARSRIAYTSIWILSLFSITAQAIGVYVIRGDSNFHPSRIWSWPDNPIGMAWNAIWQTARPSDAESPDSPHGNSGGDAPPLPVPALRMSAWGPIQEMLYEGHRVLLAYAPSEIALPVRDHGSLTGSFGLFPDAYENGGRTDGVEFVIDFVKSNGLRMTLFHRLLQPVTDAADRGHQTFTIDLSGLSGEVVLMTRCGPQYNEGWDWSFWSGLQFH